MHSALTTTDVGNTPAAGRRILVVEDNPVNQRLAVTLLKRMGWIVDLACNGFEAIAALERQNFGLVLMDVQMPGMDGLTATREIRRRFPAESQPAIIAFTANTLPGDREQCLAAGMDDFLSKPVDPAEMSAKLDRWNTAYHGEGGVRALPPFKNRSRLQPA
jgi:two-component system sensor histidine kinase/response regulator